MSIRLYDSTTLRLYDLKLEIDEGLEVGGDKLVENHGQEHHEGCHEPKGHPGEPETVAALETCGKPVYNHADSEEDEHGGVVGEDVGYLCKVPLRADALHHPGGGAPGGLVGFGWIEVGTRTEEQAGERDEDECDEHGPGG